VNLLDAVYELLRSDWEAGGRGLATSDLWERLFAADPTLNQATVEQSLFALLQQGVVGLDNLPLPGGMSAAVWRIVPERQDAAAAAIQKRAAPAPPVEDVKALPLQCLHCGRSDFIVGRWCTRCMKGMGGESK
jgi:hypothetical protein